MAPIKWKRCYMGSKKAKICLQGFSCCSLQGRIGIKIMGRKAEGGIDKGMWARRGTCIQFMAFSRTGGAVA